MVIYVTRSLGIRLPNQSLSTYAVLGLVQRCSLEMTGILCLQRDDLLWALCLQGWPCQDTAPTEKGVGYLGGLAKKECLSSMVLTFFFLSSSSCNHHGPEEKFPSIMLEHINNSFAKLLNDLEIRIDRDCNMKSPKVRLKII